MHLRVPPLVDGRKWSVPGVQRIREHPIVNVADQRSFGYLVAVVPRPVGCEGSKTIRRPEAGRAA